jgi:hypothetical protein
MLCKSLCCIALALACSAAHAQSKDSVPDYMKQYNFRYYQLPGQPDSETYFKNMDSIYHRKLLYDSLLKQRMITPPVIRYTVMNEITLMRKCNYNDRKFKDFVTALL